MTKVLLQKNIPKVGKKGETKEVSDGYARNYLVPRGLAVLATSGAVHAQKERTIREQQHIEKERNQYAALSATLLRMTLATTMKAGEKGSAFGSVGAAKILALLHDKGVALDKHWLLLEHPLKTFGEHAVPFELPFGIKGTIRIVVTQER